MLDIKFIRENPELVKAAAKKKHLELDLDRLLILEEKRRVSLPGIEELRAKQNGFTDKIAATRDGGERQKMIDEMKILKEDLRQKETEFDALMKEWRIAMLQVPNIPDVSVPEGASDRDNQEVRKWGTLPKLTFVAKSHVELMQKLNIVDFERGAKVAGFRGYFLKNDGALLAMAIWNLALAHFVKKGFEPMLTPTNIRKEVFLDTGYLPQGEEDLYKTQDETYLSGTAEVPTMGYFMDELVPRGSLPKKFISFSPCFRREAGSHGKDTKGLIRVHEFFKLEQVVLCEASHEESVKLHEELTKNAEELIQMLELPYHVVANCGGDLGLGQVKKYDIEVWVPSEQRYRETHSSSYFHDFQTRRLNIRYKDADGMNRFVHSLNNTAIATPRILVSLVENNQREDGSIALPKALHAYMGKEEIKSL